MKNLVLALASMLALTAYGDMNSTGQLNQRNRDNTNELSTGAVCQACEGNCGNYKLGYDISATSTPAAQSGSYRFWIHAEQGGIDVGITIWSGDLGVDDQPLLSGTVYSASALSGFEGYFAKEESCVAWTYNRQDELVSYNYPCWPVAEKVSLTFVGDC